MATLRQLWRIKCTHNLRSLSGETYTKFRAISSMEKKFYYRLNADILSDPVTEADIPKTAIIMPFRMFEFLFMSFGIRNVAQTFQHFINEVLDDLEFCFAYVDDIASSAEEHLKYLPIFSSDYKYTRIIINLVEVCIRAARDRILRLFSNRRRGSAMRVQAIREYPILRTAKDLRRYLGILNFYWSSCRGPQRCWRRWMTCSKIIRGGKHRCRHFKRDKCLKRRKRA